MPENNGACVWKWICTLVAGVSVSILGTGFAAWHSFGGGVKRDEVAHMIETLAPYAKDKEKIQIQLSHIKETVDRIERQMKALHNKPNQ